MPALRFALFAGVLAIAPAAACAATHQAPTTAAPSSPIRHHTPVAVADNDSEDPDAEFETVCEGTAATHVTPDTAAARKAAAKSCANIDAAIKSAPWPSGLHPVNPGDVHGGGR